MFSEAIHLLLKSLLFPSCVDRQSLLILEEVRFSRGMREGVERASIAERRQTIGPPSADQKFRTKSFEAISRSRNTTNSLSSHDEAPAQRPEGIA